MVREHVQRRGAKTLPVLGAVATTFALAVLGGDAGAARAAPAGPAA
jgi:hypothetical protein